MAPPSPAASSERATNVRWVIFALACFTSFLTYVHRYSWGAAKPYMKAEYGLDDKELGALDALFNLTYAVGQFPGGWAGDVLGPRFVIPIAVVLWSVLMIGPALTNRVWGLSAFRLGFGAAQAPCYPNLGRITKSWFPLRIRTSLQGVVASFSGRAGGAAAPFLIGTVMMTWIGLTWQASLFALAGVGLLYAIGFWFVFRNAPADHPLVNDAERELIEAGEIPTQPGPVKINWTRPNTVNLGVFMAASFCSTFADNIFVYYMPQLLIEKFKFSDAQMGIWAGLPVWGGAVGGMCGGILNDVLIRRTGNRRVVRSLVSCSGKLIAAAIIAASLLLQDGRLVMLALFCCKFFSDWSQPTWWGTVTDIGGAAAGRVFGMVNMMGSLGAFTAGYAMGYVLDEHGWNALFLFVGGMYVLTAFFWAFVNCTRRLA